MAFTILEACQNKKINPKTPFEFENFPSQGSIRGLNNGPFRENVRLFIQECAEIQNYAVSRMPVWSTLLVSGENGIVFPLYTIEETVENSLNPFCDNCKFTGWGHHFVSKRKYHFIIPGLDHWEKRLKPDIFELRTHILYGLVHCNGYGHLICINGLKRESNFLSDTRVMNFWEHLCSSLRSRKISVRDEENLRLLYAVVDGQSWYGRWGYEFCRGSFGVTKEQYETAVEYLKSLGLEKIVTDFKRIGKGKKIRQIVDKCREARDVPLITLSDLLRFMMGFQSRDPIWTKAEKKRIKSASENVINRRKSEEPINADALATLLGKSSRYPAHRIKFVLNQIMTVLNKSKSSDGGKACICRQELRNEIRECVGDTGLIDFVLKSITCFAMRNCIIRRLRNTSTKKLEFMIHEVLEDAETKRVPFSARNSDCNWPEEGIKLSAEVIVMANHSNENHGNENTMPWQELQDKALECTDDTEQVGRVLKSMDTSLIANEMVSSSKSPTFKRGEVAVQDFAKNDIIDFEERNVLHDALYLFNNVLLCYNDLDAVTNLLDSKNFVKEWHHEEQNLNQLMGLKCKVLPSFDELETDLKRPLSPGEIVLVSPSKTISELKVVAQTALRDTYCIMDNFIVSQIGGLKEIDPDKVVSCTIDPVEPVWVRGSGLNLSTKLRYEDGHQRFTVNCTCGTKYDDGERLAACDVCKVYQHTRCRGIDDHEAAPVDFLCSSCDAVVVKK